MSFLLGRPIFRGYDLLIFEFFCEKVMWIDDFFVGVENGSLDSVHLRTLTDDGLAYDGSCE